jgi:hypothetical protein
MVAGQTIFIDFKGDAFQHSENLDKITREEEISTLAIDSSLCSRLVMTPLQIRERFDLKTVYSVENLEIY